MPNYQNRLSVSPTFRVQLMIKATKSLPLSPRVSVSESYDTENMSAALYKYYDLSDERRGSSLDGQ